GLEQQKDRCAKHGCPFVSERVLVITLRSGGLARAGRDTRPAGRGESAGQAGLTVRIDDLRGAVWVAVCPFWPNRRCGAFPLMACHGLVWRRAVDQSPLGGTPMMKKAFATAAVTGAMLAAGAGSAMAAPAQAA